MTANQQELVTMWEKADDKGKQLISNMLECAVTFGEPFHKEMQELLAKGDKDGMRKALTKWTDLIKERSGTV